MGGLFTLELVFGQDFKLAQKQIFVSNECLCGLEKN